MTLSITVVGALYALPEAADGPPGAGAVTRAGGIGSQLAVLLARLGPAVRYVAGVLPGECCPELRSPLVGEGVEVAPFWLTGHGAGDGSGSSHEGQAEAPEEVLAELKPTLAGDDLGQVLWLTLELGDEELLESLAASHGEERILALHLAPPRELSAELLSRLNLVVSGEPSGGVVARCSEERQSQRGLLRRIGAYGPGRAVVLGRRSATLFDGERFFEVEGPSPAEPRLSDAVRELVFSATLSVALAEGRRVERALALALRTAALSPAAAGNFPDLPSVEALRSILGEREAPPREPRTDSLT
jgi:sugar/nucleoside kinase (ribokinase family)